MRKKKLYDGKVAVQLCESYREQGRVLQRVLRHVGTAEKGDLKSLGNLIEAGNFLQKEIEEQREAQALEIAPNLPFLLPNSTPPPPIPVEISGESTKAEEDLFVNVSKLSEESRIVEGIHAVFGSVLDRFGLQGLLGRRQYDLLRNLIMARIALPSSKLCASKNLAKHFDVDIPVDRIYRFMDTLEGMEASIQKVVLNAFRPLIGEAVEVLFFDVTTLYFESTGEDELRRFGYSKDQKTHTTQVVLALATTREGFPVGYKLFPGNTAETSTLLDAISEWRSALHINKITIVADRAMMSEKNLKLLEESGLKYVIAAKLKKLPKEIQKVILTRQNEKLLFQNEEDVLVVQEHSLCNRRLIVSHSTKRARKDARDREQILIKLKKRIGEKGTTKKLVTNRGYLSVVKESGNSHVAIDEEKVAAAAQWDGFHGVLTNIEEANHQEILGFYRRLWVIEESFRINKHTLEMRPVYHYVPRRIKAHILLCYVAFALSRYVQKRISLQCGEFSIAEIVSILIDVQYSVLKHEETQCHYRLPSKMSMEARQFYGVFNLKRNKRISKL